MRKPCCEKDGGVINKGAWSKQEDEKLKDYIAAHGEGCWRSIPKAAGLLRCGKSCRLRWINYLRPDIKRGKFDNDEEDLIIKLHALLGNRWSLIAGRLPGRTDNEVKNYWNSHLRKKLIQMGIDPNNHKPSQHLPPPATRIAGCLSSMEEASNIKTPTNCNKNDRGNNIDQVKVVGVGAISKMLASYVDDDETSSPPLDLNLNLTISVSPSLTQTPLFGRKKDDDSSEVIRGGPEFEPETSPALALFR